MPTKRLALRITGQVQGVGFRPHVYRIAIDLGLTGFVKNDEKGVGIEIQGARVIQFEDQLLSSLPALARIDKIEKQTIALKHSEKSFEIYASEAGVAKTIISPDISICDACLAELFDPKSRYYLYPFLNCTHCGPRFTITKQLPYDRTRTSMKDFQFCDDCYHEYINPVDRRYHAQPTACQNCGPKLSDSFAYIADCIKAGKIVAIKSVGGYQLICDAKNEAVIKRLRLLKNRDEKPFALMVLNLKSAGKIVSISTESKNLLESYERPIVLMPKKQGFLCERIAPGLSQYGVMLPCSSMHYLLFHALGNFPDGSDWLNQTNDTVLVVTSANLSGNPLLISDAKAKDELSKLADVVVSYNREIVCRIDDSVMQIVNQNPFFIRRARGYTPTRIQLACKIPSVLALGAHLKNTFCITREDQAFVSQYIGSLNNKETIEFFHETLAHFQQFLGVNPEYVAHDAHPDFYTTQLAQTLDLPSHTIQHHHAHIASVLAEYQIQQPVLGLALDGYGYGENGDSWGGELLLLEDVKFSRLASLQPLPLPGGDVVAKEPWRMALSVMHCLKMHDQITKRFEKFPQAKFLIDMLERKINTPFSSSCGRLFDAASAILGINFVASYEGQAAMQLESLVSKPVVYKNGWIIENSQISFLPLLASLFELNPIAGANVFHGTLIAGLVDLIKCSVIKTGINIVLLSGGCFLNRTLSEGLCNALNIYGITALLPRQLPPNDGGLSLGQAWVCGLRESR